MCEVLIEKDTNDRPEFVYKLVIKDEYGYKTPYAEERLSVGENVAKAYPDCHYKMGKVIYGDHHRGRFAAFAKLKDAREMRKEAGCKDWVILKCGVKSKVDKTRYTLYDKWATKGKPMVCYNVKRLIVLKEVK